MYVNMQSSTEYAELELKLVISEIKMKIQANMHMHAIAVACIGCEEGALEAASSHGVLVPLGCCDYCPRTGSAKYARAMSSTSSAHPICTVMPLPPCP